MLEFDNNANLIFVDKPTGPGAGGWNEEVEVCSLLDGSGRGYLRHAADGSCMTWYGLGERYSTAYEAMMECGR